MRANMGEKEKERRKGGGKNGRWSEEEKEEGRKGRKGGCEGEGYGRYVRVREGGRDGERGVSKQERFIRKKVW